MPTEKQLKYWQTLKDKIPWNKGIKLGYTPKGAFKKGNIPWNKNKKGIHLSLSSEWKKGIIPDGSILIKKGQFADEKHLLWKGDKVSYSGLHYWISRKLGKPSECEHCGIKTAKKYEWANKSGLYLRQLTDWIRLCVSCHRKYDGHSKKAWITRKLKS